MKNSYVMLLSLVAMTINGSAQSNRQPPLQSPVPITIQVTPNEVSSISPNFIGIKFGKNEFGKAHEPFTGNNTRMVENLRALSPVAGQRCNLAVGADGTEWAPSGAGQQAGQISKVDIDNLAKFLAATNCTLDYSADILNNTTANAADELSYVAETVGPNLAAVGFGNEPDTSTGYNFTASSYAHQWNTYAVAALAKNGNLAFKGPDIGIASFLGEWMTAWYAANLKLPLAYGAQHFYVNGPGRCVLCTAANMLEDRITEPYWTAMVLQKNAFEGGLAKPIPVALTETNNFYSGGAPGVSNSYASALYAFDFIFQAAQAGFSSVEFMNGDNWSEGYSPLNLVQGYSYGPKPEYYGIYLAALTGYGPMYSTTVTGARGVRAYAVSSNGEHTLNTAIVNTTDSNYSVALDLPTGTSIQACSAYVLSDTNGLTDTSGSGIKLQGGEFDSYSQIDMQTPYGVPVAKATASVLLPAYSGIVTKCSLER